VEVDTRLDTMSNIASFYFISPRKLQTQYKEKTSGYRDWGQLPHADKYIFYPKNVTEFISIDEVCLSKGELYTIITSKKPHQQNKASLIAIINGTEAKTIIEVVEKISLEMRNKVTEVTLDMARNMSLASKTCFPNAKLVIDRFHVVKLVIDAMQHLRVKYRWRVIKAENTAIKQAKERGEKYYPTVLSNGDTLKELLARSRFLFYRFKKQWTVSQTKRANLLFEKYPKLKAAYNLVCSFRSIYEANNKDSAREQFIDWKKKVTDSKIEEFNTCMNSLDYHLENILNFFSNRNTNANAESFNSKIKGFRADVRGVVDVKFFMFRLEKLFA
jgi:transposase